MNTFSAQKRGQIETLISNMSLEEKIGLMIHRAKGIPRLGIPDYNWWNEALHGVANNGEATVFPQAIALGATFDEDLVHRVAEAISIEARAKFNAVGKEKAEQYHRGLTFWAPNINIFRDPRWGRGQETYGEDPVLTSRLGTAYVRGLQGSDPYYLRAAACAKHFAVHSGPEGLRHTFNAEVSQKDLEETYLPAFKALVKSGVESVMGAYNRVNGEPACGSTYLLKQKLREEWQFQGHVVSDCWAICDFHKNHKVTNDILESIALALRSGCDLNCGDAYNYLAEAVLKGYVTEDDINRAVVRLLITLDKLGLIHDDGPYQGITIHQIDWKKHDSLALEAAEKSIVLLKNNGVLPLKKDKISYIYVTGPNATNSDALLGNYAGVSSRLLTVLEAIVEEAGPEITVTYKKGCPLAERRVNPNDWASGVTKYADVTIAVMGRDTSVEGEEGDAILSSTYGDFEDLNLNDEQLSYLHKLKESGKPLIVVLMGGAPICSPELHEIADAILVAWYPGQAGGTAVSNIVFGKTNPSGKLPVTFPKSVRQLPEFENYSMQGRTYRYMTEEPLYPFGFGLSYTKMEFKHVTGRWKSPEKDELIVSTELYNQGTIDGEEVVQLYYHWKDAPFAVPNWSLIDFKRVLVAAGASCICEFKIPLEKLQCIDPSGKGVIPTGTLQFYVGFHAPVACSHLYEDSEKSFIEIERKI
ncbi:glycoside hydrolase family 3 N-terminal domain-containing protein [Gracilinema caldarium]|uniref:Beta-glucosidase n=1 Tax=Gracilinema caldarium (strain ATCC 51460 / DSM 7334 / H1) TaxID=744872 RepID=F8F1B7_GRAC1|nr:glycoside hydrolase family 3 N-terminal domain-containing protein [Gracilinema caldarium]AEJ18761.1 Beta-glucosidase [Gracilinema caldarium DSM 7334]